MARRMGGWPNVVLHLAFSPDGRRTHPARRQDARSPEGRVLKLRAGHEIYLVKPARGLNWPIRYRFLVQSDFHRVIFAFTHAGYRVFSMEGDLWRPLKMGISHN